MKDYEKKYKEALERAKKYKLKEDLIITQDIFPELAESDDEKIRKALIYRYQGDGCICNNEYRIDYKDIRAWLENQGEQKPQRIVSAEAKEAMYDKPAWSEEDESMYIRTLGVLGKCYIGELPTKVEEEFKWFKSIKDRVLPKQEWSEKDNYYYGIIQYILNNECVGKADKENAINWLKSLKERYTWKPSDEQMEALQESIGIVGQLTIKGGYL